MLSPQQFSFPYLHACCKICNRNPTAQKMHKNTPLTYRPDIDGLRAIAVLSVVLFHLNPDFVRGGFAGVDIFFVISGYLITTVIYAQVRNGNFSFSEFYRRRINRIAPALFVLVAAVSVVGLAVLGPMDLVRLFKSGAAAGLGVSNAYFWREYGNYFSSGVDEAPLLHTWSLAVEEQFYIIWPVLVILLGRLRLRATAAVLALSLLATIAVSELGVRNFASASYYLLPTRFFELQIGSALAILVFHRGTLFGVRGAAVAGTTGLGLIFGSLFFLTSASSFPGINAVYPSIGAALIIAAGTNSNAFTLQILSAKPLVFVGLISYSMYLWHWPLIAYSHYLGIKIGALQGGVIFAASTILAWLSWRFVETPFRRTGTSMSFSAVAGMRYAVPAAALAVSAFVVIGAAGLPGRFDPRVAQYEQTVATAPNELRAKCHSSTFLYERKPDTSCILGIASKPVTFLLIGDSYANHFTGMLDVLAKHEKVAVMDYTMDGCMPVKGMGFGNVASYAAKCKMRNELSYDLIAFRKYPYVILAGSWPNDGTLEEFSALQKGLQTSIEAILASGGQPVIIRNNQGTTNANCPIRRIMHNSSGSCDTLRQPNHKQRQMFEALKEQFPAISFIDPNAAICNATTCHGMLADVPLYRDGGHLNDVGSRLIGKILIQKGVRLTPQNILTRTAATKNDADRVQTGAAPITPRPVSEASRSRTVSGQLTPRPPGWLPG